MNEMTIREYKELNLFKEANKISKLIDKLNASKANLIDAIQTVYMFHNNNMDDFELDLDDNRTLNQIESNVRELTIIHKIVHDRDTEIYRKIRIVT
jgi:hypothetical protein